MEENNKERPEEREHISNKENNFNLDYFRPNSLIKTFAPHLANERSNESLLSLLQVPLLSHLDLSDNLMGKVPFVAVGHVKALKAMDLSNNRIERIEDPFFQVYHSKGGLGPIAY